MSLFINAMDKLNLGVDPTPMLIGENGTPEYSSTQVGESLVALFFASVRNTPYERLKALYEECIQQATISAAATDKIRVITDLFVLAFQTRDCRGGKGERNLFYFVLLFLMESYPQTVLSLLPLIAEYGYYKDYISLLSLIHGSENSEIKAWIDSALTSRGYTQMLTNRILDILANQVIQDDAILEKGDETVRVSLCAKYLPRESSQFEKAHKDLFRGLLERIFSPANDEHAYATLKKNYRRLISRLTKTIDVPEVKMAGKRFAEIDFDHVPSVAMKKYRKAFANEKVKGKLQPNEEATGNRSTEEDRILCRKHLKEAIAKGGIKGKQLFPHEIVKVLTDKGNSISSLEVELFDSQWNDIRENLIKTIKEIKEKASAEGQKTNGLDLGMIVPMVDVSGSMSGIPMLVAIALGILISEINQPAFRHRFITFETTPRWVDLSSCRNIAEKVKTTAKASWGGSTNIEKAFDLIAAAIEQHHLKEEDIPAMIIFSDMQFDEAVSGSKATQLVRITRRFHDLGMKLYNKPLARPLIIFWNLRGDTVGFPATATTENVQMLSGFSPALFKHLVEGTEMQEEEGKEKTSKPIVTPYENFRKVVDDERYYKVREALAESNEGHLAAYNFVPPPPVVTVTATATEEGKGNP